jgi:hypothetical protein
MEVMFIADPDRAAITVYSAEQLKQAWNQINERLLVEFSGWSPADWLERHTAVSAKDFLSEPHRNRYTVLLSMNTHMAFQFGQAILAEPRDRRLQGNGDGKERLSHASK